MKNSMIFRGLAAAAVAVPVAALTVSATAAPISYEEQMAHQEEARILTSPIAGIQNSHWYDYRINVTETKKELSSDLRRATDLEDTRDAWGEYAHELKDNREDYVKEMADEGYKFRITVE